MFFFNKSEFDNNNWPDSIYIVIRNVDYLSDIEKEVIIEKIVEVEVEKEIIVEKIVEVEKDLDLTFLSEDMIIIGAEYSNVVFKINTFVWVWNYSQCEWYPIKGYDYSCDRNVSNAFLYVAEKVTIYTRQEGTRVKTHIYFQNPIRLDQYLLTL